MCKHPAHPDCSGCQCPNGHPPCSHCVDGHNHYSELSDRLENCNIPFDKVRCGELITLDDGLQLMIMTEDDYVYDSGIQECPDHPVDTILQLVAIPLDLINVESFRRLRNKYKFSGERPSEKQKTLHDYAREMVKDREQLATFPLWPPSTGCYKKVDNFQIQVGQADLVIVDEIKESNLARKVAARNQATHHAALAIRPSLSLREDLRLGVPTSLISDVDSGD